MRFLDVSKPYRSHFLQGHYSSFHASLFRAAIHQGHDFSIAATERRTSSSDSLVGLRFTRRDWGVIARETELYLREQSPTTVFVYEGSLDALVAFVEVARRLPQHTFIINLFLIDELFLRASAFGSTSASTDATKFQQTSQNPPKNMRILAETQKRVLLGRAMGLPICGAWPHHTSLDLTVDLPRPELNLVVIGVTDWQLLRSKETISDIDSVLKLSKSAYPELRFKILGTIPPKARRALVDRFRRVRALPGASDGPLSAEEYARTMGESGLVWLPTQGVYRDHSSGKALDAMVSGRPVLVPAGTFGQQEQERWIPGAPTYRNRNELVELFCARPTILPRWSEEAVAARPRTTVNYSPERAIEALIAYATECAGS